MLFNSSGFAIWYSIPCRIYVPLHIEMPMLTSTQSSWIPMQYVSLKYNLIIIIIIIAIALLLRRFFFQSLKKFLNLKKSYIWDFQGMPKFPCCQKWKFRFEHDIRTVGFSTWTYCMCTHNPKKTASLCFFLTVSSVEFLRTSRTSWSKKRRRFRRRTGREQERILSFFGHAWKTSNIHIHFVFEYI